MDVVTVANIGGAISDPTRLRVLDAIDGKLAVGEIAAIVNVTSPTISHHVGVLERAGLVEVVRKGRRRVPRRLTEAWRVLLAELR